ncbi:hypothetical protein D1B31_15300 [Neobacillus notoginsengisoli]|uniref:Uncharacterized protein n=1 Tax=Neobacillus notoginsengisoli TaxID=1578198 RepID=A0A417YS77_9BACI|nr:hypothetical protein [Neobacillus notoginsengisoli]RHW38141.1 hypothetical protein D1B31_15300 [Neobacillus notoginsengisoli]
MNNRTNQNRFIILSLIFLFIAGTLYYFRPLDAEKVFPKLYRVEKVTLVVKFEGEKEQEFIDLELTGDKAETFIGLIGMAKYRRAFGKMNIQSQTNAYDTLFVLDSNNYSVVINDQGYVVVDTGTSEKKYKVLSSKKDSLIRLIDEIFEQK